MYLDPDRMTPQFEGRIARWLEVNGCPHWIALEPIVVRGKVAEYTALSRRLDPKGIPDRQVHGDDIVPLGRRKIRLRIPLHKVP